jgi:hypothetical protein
MRIALMGGVRSSAPGATTGTSSGRAPGDETR